MMDSQFSMANIIQNMLDMLARAINSA